MNCSRRTVAAVLFPVTLVSAGGSLAACGAPAAGAAGASSARGELAAVAAPDVELRGAKDALVRGETVAMDSVAEGLAWPALRAALGRKTGDHRPLTIAAARDVPMVTVLRAVWTLRDADLRLQTPDASGVPRVLEIRPKPDAPPNPADAECHAAVFVAPNGDVRVAAPGGPHVIHAPDAAGMLASALAAERATCTIRYLGFGAESAAAPWSAVFDVARAVDRDKSAGDARYVLAEPLLAPPR